MAKLKLERPGIYSFYCPGCEARHTYWTSESGNGLQWNFNNDMDKPTFSPSLLNRWGKYVDPNFEEPDTQEYGAPKGGWSGICHLYLTDGYLQFLSDCTHELAGKIVPLPERDSGY